MSLIICVSDSNSTTLVSEDLAGITDSTGKFTPVDGGHMKSVRLTPDIIVGFLGSVFITRRFKTCISSLACLSFDSLVEIIPRLARALVQNAGQQASLQVLLTGWDGNKIRTVTWNWDNDFAPEEEAVQDEPVYWVLGTSREAHEAAYALLTGPGVKVPDCLPEVFEKLSERFPQIGTGLTTHTVTRPSLECGHPEAEETANQLVSVAYHNSSFRSISTTARSGTHTAPNGGDAGYFTVASFSVTIPTGYSKYKGTFLLSIGGTLATIGTINGRIFITGGPSSNVVSFAIGSGTSASGTVTVTGITPGSTITVNVQVQGVGTDAAVVITGNFSQNQYTDQDASNLI